MLVVALLHPVAKLDEVFVRIDNAPFERLRGTCVVSAVVERYPAPAELFTSTNLWPGQTTAHAVKPLSPKTAPRGGEQDWK